MGKLDALSWRADHGSDAGDNKNIVLLEPKLFEIRALTGLKIDGDEAEIVKDIRDSIEGGDLEKAVIELRKDRQRNEVRSVEWWEEDGLLMFHRKIYVPRNKGLRRCIVEQHHDSIIAGHSGWFKTLELISQNY